MDKDKFIVDIKMSMHAKTCICPYEQIPNNCQIIHPTLDNVNFV